MIFNKNCFKTLFFPCKKITLNQQQILVERKISVGNTMYSDFDSKPTDEWNSKSDEINCNNEWSNFPRNYQQKV